MKTRSHKEFITDNISNNIILCWCKLFRFPCSAVRIYDGGNIVSNFVKCYECFVLLHIPALITKRLSPDGICTKMDALYSVIISLHCYTAISLAPHGFNYRLYSTQNLINGIQLLNNKQKHENTLPYL